MKVLHIAPIGHHAEGIGTVIEKIVPLQILLGNEVRIVSVYGNVVYKDLPITTIRNKRIFSSYIRKWKPDIVQFHSMYLWKYLIFAKVLTTMRIPYLTQMHGALSEANYQKNHWKKWIANKLFWNSFLRDSSTIVYLNKSEYNRCIVKQINASCDIVPNGCELPDEVKKEKQIADIIDIIYIGRISCYHKGLDILIEAISILKKQDVGGFKISFYGNEDDADVEWLKEKLHGLEDLASYNGGIYGKDKDLLFRKTDIFILTSRYEGMPMGVLEALSYGVPCLVTLGTNMAEEIVGNNAGWCSEITPLSIVATIQDAIKDYKENVTTYRNNAVKLSENYNWENIAKKSIDVLQRVVSKR